MRMDVQLRSLYEVECWREGRLLWSDSFWNLVTTVGKNILLDQTFYSGTVTPTWYISLVNNASFTQYAAADTMSSHAGWLEATGYSNATRVAYTMIAAVSGSTSNDASRALFNINATATIRGAFLVNQSTKGGTTGTLYGEGDFAAARSVVSGDVLSIKITLTD